jgi:hypothetical protein
MTALTPRSDVASGGLGGALAVLLMLAFGGQEFDADAIGAAFAVVLTFAGGYIPTKYKPLWAAVTAPLATLITTFIGAFFFGVRAGQLAACSEPLRQSFSSRDRERAWQKDRGGWCASFGRAGSHRGHLCA